MLPFFLELTRTESRMISIKRRCGLATRLLREGVALAREKLGAKRLIIGAQTYACPVYEKVGFVRTDYEYIEDGIPHVRMTMNLESLHDTEERNGVVIN